MVFINISYDLNKVAVYLTLIRSLKTISLIAIIKLQHGFDPKTLMYILSLKFQYLPMQIHNHLLIVYKYKLLLI